MHYQKIITDQVIIEFHNNWLGEETIIVNGQIVSKKSSVMGTHHHFNLLENGKSVSYILTTKVNSHLQVSLDLRKDGVLIQEDVPVKNGTKPKTPENTFKKSGILKIKTYEIEEGIADLKKGLELAPNDPEIYFYLACGYSIQEKTMEGFESIKKAVEHNLQHTETILNHDMLAFLRMEEGFEAFLNSNFTSYKKDQA